MKNEDLVKAWAAGKNAGKKGNGLSCEEGALFSYHLKIGHRASNGSTIVADFTSGSGNYISQTTSCHVGLAARLADDIMCPEAWRVTVDRDSGSDWAYASSPKRR
tara:strand:- start:232 stop:546 length:315 start_codon:yes stop_codon:yes gene_type:complete